ncbi:hypothetical protein [Pseudoxanthomonas indica]|uniref:Uncharacterized protein n=1 Tax=Pseudoxanthomonas indica TaxID=428993 RepID=A0A1T5K109_9GAMM|nr:hypothetical protein [Pseudoxanthomonas indica]GGD45883.1 hypothetical protein GCM10007235_17330 [Pseudoxanthomonas indica]SKC57457.1 hypothetical protein SAMN06296058_1271 [Pseudoxanthomonas indica]
MNPAHTLLALAALAVLNIALGWLVSSRHERARIQAEQREAQAQARLLQRRDQEDGDDLLQRANAVADACHQAVDRAQQAWRAGDSEQRRLWVGIHEACGDEFRDMASQMRALEAA